MHRMIEDSTGGGGNIGASSELIIRRSPSSSEERMAPLPAFQKETERREREEEDEDPERTSLSSPSSVSDLLLFLERAKVPNPVFAANKLELRHGVTTKEELLEILAHPELALEVPTLWRLRVLKFLEKERGEGETTLRSLQLSAPVSIIEQQSSAAAIEERSVSVFSSSTSSFRAVERFWGGKAPLSLPCAVQSEDTTSASAQVVEEEEAASPPFLCCRPCGDDGPELQVLQGDLTACRADAIVNPANSCLKHGGGLAAAIAAAAGPAIKRESDCWIRTNGSLPVGRAMSTAAGDLPCRYVIHTVGPDLSNRLSSQTKPTQKDNDLLRSAVRSSLLEAERLHLSSIAIPGISTGIFSYPRAQAAREIVEECWRFCYRGDTSLRSILLVNIDQQTFSAFRRAACRAADEAGTMVMPCDGFPFLDSPRSLLCSQREGLATRIPSARTEKGEGEESRYKAGGILLVRVNGTHLEVLLGVEFRPMERKAERYLILLGGKAHSGEDPLLTACREFSEEVKGIISCSDMLSQMKEKGQRLWLSFAKYFAFLAHLDDPRIHSLPEEFERRKRRNKGKMRSLQGAIRSFLPWDTEDEAATGDEQDHLLWVSWRELLAVCRDSKKGKVHTPWGSFKVSEFLRKLVNTYKEEAEEIFQSLCLRTELEKELRRVDGLEMQSDEELTTKLLGCSWRLQLQGPPPPPPSPIQTLPPEDEDYKKLLKALPEDFASSVVSIRKVKTASQRTKFLQELQRLKAEAKKTAPEVLQPLFHGTPERWRATAIAINGFDLSIQLHGRSDGNGVYTSTDPQVAFSYTGPKGSVLLLRGIKATDCQTQGDSTIVSSSSVFIFPNAKALLPLLIADFAASDERDAVELGREQALEEIRKEKERQQVMKDQIKKRESQSLKDMATRLRNTLQVYSGQLRKIEERSSLLRASSSATLAAAEEERMQETRGAPLPKKTEGKSVRLTGLSSVSLSPLRLFLMEKSHFSMGLPLYEFKPRIVELIRSKEVLVLMAETGSGKSTQLPQIILDEVLPSTDKRRIAVLEPRRVNAISLCRRVAQERKTEPGEEVGYTIGRGESNVTATTRIEFMTHGLFVQLAKDSELLLKCYSAVIVDEAHERSVDVDLSLALLKRALKHLQSTKKEDDDGGGGKRILDAAQEESFFRVVVTSATIEAEAERFRDYLSPAQEKSALLSLPGRAFPVLVEHREDAEVDAAVIGTAGVGKVLSSYATQTAVDLLRRTKTGNILIFLPGEGTINEAVQVAKAQMLGPGPDDIEREEESEEDLYRAGTYNSFFFRMELGSKENEGEEEGDSTILAESSGRDTEESQSKTGQRKTEEEKGEHTRREIAVCVIGFHGKISRSERDLVLNPPPDVRMVIFTTNLAETGVTIPEVRYVIDTGLERRVRWNNVLDINEMVTDRVSASSMRQRTGRAGRTASGICIRLFPASEVEQLRSLPPPGVQSSMIYKVVLLMKLLQSKESKEKEEELELLDPIPPVLLEKATENLLGLGALQEDGSLTREGNALLTLGVDLRLGRFLLACGHFGCLVSGLKIASVLVAADAPEKLLPQRGAKRKGRELNWCQVHSLEMDVLLDAETARNHLMKVLNDLGFSLVDEEDKWKENGGLRRALLRALCAAYCDQLAIERSPRHPKAGYTRLLDEERKAGALKVLAQFAEETQPENPYGSSPSVQGGRQKKGGLAESQEEEKKSEDQYLRQQLLPSTSPSSLLSSPSSASLPAAQHSQVPAAQQQEPVVKLGSCSTLWHLDGTPPTSPEGGVKADAAGAQDKGRGRFRLVVFSSIMLTDGGRRPEPTVQLLSVVNPEDVTAGAPDWCRLAEFDALLDQSRPQTLTYHLTPGMRRTILMDRGRWLGKLHRKFPSIAAAVEGDKLIVSCPLRSFALIEFHIHRLLGGMAAETVVLDLPRKANMGLIIGKQAQNVKSLRDSINTLLATESKGAGRRHVSPSAVIVDAPNRTIKLTLEGASKSLMSAIVGRIQSHIMRAQGADVVPRVAIASGPRGQEMLQNPRLRMLTSSEPPSSWSSRDDVMLQLAHALVWKGNVSIYGGFLRDWVIRGESASDIDAEISPPATTVSSVLRMLRVLLAQPQPSARRLTVSTKGPKGAAIALMVSGPEIRPIDIDLVDPSAVTPQVAPGVDSDAGNLLLNKQEALRKKIPGTGDALRSSLEHVRKKEFILFYDLLGQHHDRALVRLRKYLQRGWTCLSPVPPQVLQTLPEAEQQLVRPKPKHDRKWWMEGEAAKA